MVNILKRILIVDDEKGVLLVLRDALSKLSDGYHIVTAQNGREGLDLALAEPFDLVITDVRMPVMGGVELTEAIKSARPDTPVIWMTAHGFALVEDDAARLGVLQCLQKPLDLAEIRQAVQQAL
jgi:DNA-binding NtrC family response regulator